LIYSLFSHEDARSVSGRRSELEWRSRRLGQYLVKTKLNTRDDIDLILARVDTV